jgi:hypothetical protein
MRNFTLNSMKRTMTIIAMVFMTTIVLGQMPNAITISPAGATAYDTITITLDPSKACFQAASLVGASVIKMHSGVTINTQTWQNVIAFDGVGLDGTKTSLTPNGDGTYSIKYLPVAYYGFPVGSTITQICAVFNGGDWNSDARDGDVGLHTTCPDFFIPIHYTVSAPSFVFTVNMQKAMNDGIFDPASGDVVYAVLEGHDTVPMVTLGGANAAKFTATISSGVDSGVVYNYKFRINTNTYETVERQITGAPGPTAVENWWNDQALAPPNHIILQVDMTYQKDLGKFHPASDFVDVAGSFNGWSKSSHLVRPDTSKLVYQIDTIMNDSLTTQHFKFRINGSWADSISEFPAGGPDRYLWIPAHPITFKYVYNNFDTGSVPITFKVRMSYQIKAGHFLPKHDYLDIAGDINGWNGNDVLFRRDTATSPDSIWAITLLAKRTWIGSGNMQGFKFRFNGNWNTSEFPGGGPNRTVTILDTAGGVKNIVDVWYDNLNPNIPTPPWAYNLKISGELIVPNVLTGSYTYEDVNSLPEGNSIYQWIRADSVTQKTPVLIAGANTLTYTLAAADAGKFVGFVVVPMAQGTASDSLIGHPAYVYSSAKIGGVGIPVVGNSDVKFFPNPVSGVLNFVNLSNIQRIEIFNVVGQRVNIMETKNAGSASMNTSNLKSGVYFIKFYSTDNSYSIAKFIKN